MGSYDYGKDHIVRWVKDHFPKGASCLDVGACNGKWARLLGDYLDMSACEIWQPNITEYGLGKMYCEVFCEDIADLEYKWYDLVIFGDVLEHMSIEDAQRVLKYAERHCKDYIVALPFMYSQDEIYGNPYERHIQNDLNDKTIAERYPQIELILKPTNDYAYYHRKVGNGEI